jgi:hypothetical protein
MAKSVAIVQSNYIPWKGYFDLINLVDEFILLDDVQYTRRDWRNRNRIKTPAGPSWLTIPVEVKGKYLQRIDETVISDSEWNRRHWHAIVHAYRQARYFDAYKEAIQSLYLGSSGAMLSQVNYRFLTGFCDLLGVRTKISWSTDYPHHGAKTERLVTLCKATGATSYLSGPSARSYLEEDLFRAEGIAVHYMNYDGYPEYEQLYPPFVHAVSIIDLLLSVGPEAARYMKSFTGHGGTMA